MTINKFAVTDNLSEVLVSFRDEMMEINSTDDPEYFDLYQNRFIEEFESVTKLLKNDFVPGLIAFYGHLQFGQDIQPLHNFVITGHGKWSVMKVVVEMDKTAQKLASVLESKHLLDPLKTIVAVLYLYENESRYDIKEVYQLLESGGDDDDDIDARDDDPYGLPDERENWSALGFGEL